MSFDPIVDLRPSDVVWPRLAWPPAHVLTGNIVELSTCVPDRDAAALFEALDHDEVWRHLAGRPSSAEEYAVSLGKRLSEGRWVWVVRLLRPLSGLPAGAVVGTTSFLEVSIDDARVEIGATAYSPLV